MTSVAIRVVNLAGEEECKVFANPTTNAVCDLKRDIQAKLGLSRWEQRLYSNGAELRDDELLSVYVEDGSQAEVTLVHDTGLREVSLGSRVIVAPELDADAQKIRAWRAGTVRCLNEDGTADVDLDTGPRLNWLHRAVVYPFGPVENVKKAAEKASQILTGYTVYLHYQSNADYNNGAMPIARYFDKLPEHIRTENCQLRSTEPRTMFTTSYEVIEIQTVPPRAVLEEDIVELQKMKDTVEELDEVGSQGTSRDLIFIQMKTEMCDQWRVACKRLHEQLEMQQKLLSEENARKQGEAMAQAQTLENKQLQSGETSAALLRMALGSLGQDDAEAVPMDIKGRETNWYSSKVAREPYAVILPDGQKMYYRHYQQQTRNMYRYSFPPESRRQRPETDGQRKVRKARESGWTRKAMLVRGDSSSFA